MAGAATATLRSAYIKETTAGTTPATPAFTTSADGFMMTAGAEVSELRTLQAGGGRDFVSIAGLPVRGTKQGKLMYGREDDLLETLLQGAWTADVLKDSKTIKTVSVENAIAAGAGGTLTMMRYRGVQAVGGSIIMNSGADVEYSFDLAGLGSDDSDTTIITGATYSDPTVISPMVSSLDVGSITSSAHTIDCIQRAEIQFTYDRRDPQPKLGSYDLCGITPGAFVPVLRLRIYVEANFAAMYDAARAEQEQFAVNFPLGNASGSKYTINFPYCQFAANNLDFSGPDAFHDVEMLPCYDPDTNNSIVVVTRAIA